MTTTQPPSNESAPVYAVCDPPEVDLYGLAHKGLRRGLSEMLGRLGATSPDEDLAPVLRDLEGLLHLCERHAHHEDTVLHPALQARRAGAARELDREHRTQDMRVAELRALGLWLAKAPAERRRAIVRTLYLRFATFVAESLVHMDREEALAQPALSALYSKEELLAIRARMLGGISPEDRAAFHQLMLPALDRDERRLLLASLSAE